VTLEGFDRQFQTSVIGSYGITILTQETSKESRSRDAAMGESFL